MLMRRSEPHQHRLDFIAMQGIDNFGDPPVFPVVTPLPYPFRKEQPKEESSNEQQKNRALDKKHDSADGWNR